MPVRPLSTELAEKARVELFEDQKKLEDGLVYLKEWLAKTPHLRARTDDQWLAAFLRGCKFSLERTKEKIDLYYSLRSIAPDLNSLRPKNPRFFEILKLGVTLILPKTVNPTDPRVVLVRIGQYDPLQYSINEVFSMPHVLQQIMLMEDDNLIVSGGIHIMDLAGATLAHITQITPTQIKKMTVSGQDATPIRMKGTHHLNMPTGFETLLNIAKSFLNEKNKQRLHVHKDFESLYKHAPKEILPAEYGGNGGTVQEIIDYWVKKVEEYSSWLEEDEQYGTDESKRPGKPRTAEDMFGLEGSFRQLQFD